MKRTKKTIIIVMCLVAVLVFACSCFMLGCDNNDIENKTSSKEIDVVYEKTDFYWDKECKDFIVVCNTYSELNSSLSRNGYPSFDNDNVREYVKEHSKDKALVLCAFTKNGYSGKYHINNVKVGDEKLTMYVKRPESNVASDISISVYLIAGVDKSLVSGIKELTYEFV